MISSSVAPKGLDTRQFRIDAKRALDDVTMLAADGIPDVWTAESVNVLETVPALCDSLDEATSILRDLRAMYGPLDDCVDPLYWILARIDSFLGSR